MFRVNNKLTDYDTVGTTLKHYMEAIGTKTTEPEEINVEDSLSRILYDDILTKQDLPGFNKALVDGYAVKSTDIALADFDSPVILKIIGEIHVENNESLKISKNQTVKVSTGTIIPENADAVVLPENTLIEGNSIKVLKSIVMGGNIVKKGEDMTSGEIFIRKKRKIRPMDIGGLIGIGYKKIRVYKKPVVSIIPTGSELVSIDITPKPDQIISSNGYVLKGIIEQLGGIGIIQPIVKDNLDLVRESIIKSLAESDIVIVSGGSSIGTKDYTLRAVQSIPDSKIISHGVTMRPGKHILLALINNKPVIGLPGHPVSSATSFLIFVKPIITQFAGNPRSFWQEIKDNIKINAILAKDVESPKGMEDYVRVRLKLLDNGKITAYPYAGKSSFLSTLVKAHGIIKLPSDCSKLYEGDRIEVLLF